MSIYELELNEEEKKALTIMGQYMLHSLSEMREPWAEPGILEVTYKSLIDKLTQLTPKATLVMP